MRAYVALIILLLAACAIAASLLARPTEPPLVADDASPGVWGTYASVPHMPGAQMCKPILYPRHPAPTEYVRA